MADQDVIGSTNSCEADCGHRVGGALWCRNLPAPHRRWESEGVGVSRRFLGSWPHGPGNLCEAAGALWLGSDARGLRGTVLDGEGRRRAAGLVSTGLRAMLVRSTSARHRIRHGIRHTAARAGRGLCPCVANGRLRYMLIGYARVLKSGWLPVAGPAARRPAGRGRRRRQRLPVFLDPMWWVAPRGTRLSRNARSSHRPALVSLDYRSGSDQARCQPVVFRAGELNEDRASRAVDPCEHLLQ